MHIMLSVTSNNFLPSVGNEPFCFWQGNPEIPGTQSADQQGQGTCSKKGVTAAWGTFKVHESYGPAETQGKVPLLGASLTKSLFLTSVMSSVAIELI